MRLLLGSVPLTLSVAARAALFLGLSWQVYATASAEQVAGFFQDMFLQSVLITFFSASSFFAVVSKTWDDKRNAVLMLTHVLLAIIGVIAVWLLVIFDLAGVETHLLVTLLVGAVSTGLASPLIGLIVRSQGTWQAYGPAIVLAPLFLGVILVPGLDPVTAAIGAIVAFQVTTFLYLAFVGRAVFAELLAQRWTIWTRDVWAALWATFAFGALNTVTVGYLYWFREAWVPLQVPEIAAAVLFVFRILDTFIGIVLTDLGGRIDAIRAVEERKGTWAMRIAGLGVVVIGLLWGLGTLDLRPFVLAVVGQLLLECVRLPLQVFFLYQGARRSGLGYLVYTAGMVALSFAVLMVWPLQAFPTGFYVFMAVTSLLTASITCAYAALRPVLPKH